MMINRKISIMRRATAFSLPMMAAAPRESTTPSVDVAASSKPIVFVAGATGNVGRRLVRKLAEAGCAVRAGSRDKQKFEEKVGDLSTLTGQVEHVSFEVTEEKTYEPAIGPASVVISALGAAFSFGAVDGSGIARLMSTSAGMGDVQQLIVVSSIGVGRPWAFPAAALNLFGGVLLFKDYSEKVTRKVARETGKKYFIVRPGGMESPTDEFSQTHNLLLEPRNSLAGGLVSNLQVAELIVAAVLNPNLADGKTVEAIAKTDAPKVDLETLLKRAPRD